MKLILKKIVILSLVALSIGPFFAQTATEYDDLTENESYKSEEIIPREFDQDKWEELTKNIVFEKEKEKKEIEKKESAAPIFNGISKTAKTILFGLAILILVFIIIKIFVGNVTLTNKKVSSTRPMILEEVEKNLQESDLDRYLREALTNKNYRVAIRLYYLMIIKELSAKNLIKWKLDKTNRDYLSEMSSHTSFPDFRSITRTFDKVWYGEQVLEQKDFSEIGPLFEQYIKTIKS